MSSHYNKSQFNQLNQQPLKEEIREGQTRSVASKNPSQESQQLYLQQLERAHQQNKTSSDTSFELMNTNTEDSENSDSYETKNFTTSKAKNTTSVECKFWNNGQCVKPNCRYQHFCLKNLIKIQNPEIKISSNEAIKDNNLIIIEVTELKYLQKSKIRKIITQQLNADTQQGQIKIAITNKRRHKKLINNIKLKKQNCDGSDDEQTEDWEELIKNIDSLKNNLKEKTPINKLNEIKGKQDQPSSKCEQQYSQLQLIKLIIKQTQKQIKTSFKQLKNVQRKL